MTLYIQQVVPCIRLVVSSVSTVSLHSPIVSHSLHSNYKKYVYVTIVYTDWSVSSSLFQGPWLLWNKARPCISSVRGVSREKYSQPMNEAPASVEPEDSLPGAQKRSYHELLPTSPHTYKLGTTFMPFFHPYLCLASGLLLWGLSYQTVVSLNCCSWKRNNIKQQERRKGRTCKPKQQVEKGRFRDEKSRNET
jgi:hypothetical protein